MKTGTELITEERIRQIAVEDYSHEHDDQHNNGELAEAAAAYAMVPRREDGDDRPEGPPEIWPWAMEYWKPSPKDRIRELVKAGALIAAEIDRLQRVSNREWLCRGLLT